MYNSTDAVVPPRTCTDPDELASVQIPKMVDGGDDRLQQLTPDSMLNFIGFGPFQVLVCALAGLTIFAYGLDGAVLLFIGPSVQDLWNLTTVQYSVLPASTAGPNIFGALFYSFLSDRYGRVWPYVVVLSLCGLFSIASAFANSFPLLVVFRCFASFSIGGIPVLVVPTLMEFLPVRNRAKATILTYVVGYVGQCVACGLCWWLIPTFSVRGWRYFAVAAGIPALMAALFRLLFNYQSPRYLFIMNQYNKSWNIFKRMAQFNGKKLTDFATKDEFIPQQSTISIQKKPETIKFDCKQFIAMFRPSVYLRTTLVLSAVILTESIGYLGASVFLPEFLNSLPGVSVYFTIFVSFVAQIPGTLLLSIIVEWPKIGRLNSLRFFSLLSAFFYLLLALVQTAVSIPVLLILIYFSSSPILSLIYAYISETYPTRIRSFSNAFFYTLQAVAYATGSLLGAYSSVAPFQWLFPAIWAGIFVTQFLAALILKYEPYGKNLIDVTL